jgi:2-C-methyl-D-erythritol 2,4-cyclodiphosphate synthase
MGYIVHNADATVVAEAPRLAPHVPAMRGNLARALRVDDGRVNVKSTSAKLMGLIGAGEGIAAFAVVSLLPAPPAGNHAPPSL